LQDDISDFDDVLFGSTDEFDEFGFISSYSGAQESFDHSPFSAFTTVPPNHHILSNMAINTGNSNFLNPLDNADLIYGNVERKKRRRSRTL